MGPFPDLDPLAPLAHSEGDVFCLGSIVEDHHDPGGLQAPRRLDYCPAHGATLDGEGT